MSILDDDAKKQLSEILSKMQDEVELLMFTQEVECESCAQTRAFIEEFGGISDKLKVTVYDFMKDKAKAEELGVDKIPAIVILDSGGTDTGIRFYGIPAGYEINSLTHAVLAVSGEKEALPGDILKRIGNVDREVRIETFIGLTCPYCPAAVATANMMALENPKIRSETIEGSTFPHLLMKHNIMGVPAVVIDGGEMLSGAQPIEKMLDVIEGSGGT
jgi:glutaredoxin-like protein